jgi:hypothetical protein
MAEVKHKTGRRSRPDRRWGATQAIGDLPD